MHFQSSYSRVRDHVRDHDHDAGVLNRYLSFHVYGLRNCMDGCVKLYLSLHHVCDFVRIQDDHGLVTQRHGCE